MTYRYATENLDYSDYSSGRVLYSRPGLPAFPVRLASEIFQRALTLLRASRPLTLYDPTCGGAYHLSALGFLHGQSIGAILASDVDAAALELARRNLALLTRAGLDQRAAELERMLEAYGKESHAAALRSAAVLRQRLDSVLAGREIRTRVFAANALDGQQIAAGLGGEAPDLVISDVPYGQLSGWRPLAGPEQTGREPLWTMLEALRPVLHPGALVAIAADKLQKITHPAYTSIEKFQAGKRQVRLLRPG